MAIIGVFTDIGVIKAKEAANNEGFLIFPTKFGVSRTKGLLSPTRTAANAGLWFTAPISGRIVVDDNTIKFIGTIPPLSIPIGTTDVVREIYLFGTDTIPEDFLFALGHTNVDIIYDPEGGSVTLELELSLTNVDLTSQIIFAFTQATEIFDHNADPNAHPDWVEEFNRAGMFVLAGGAPFKYAGQLYDKFAEFDGSKAQAGPIGGVNFEATFNGIEINGEDLVFDGIKTVDDVRADFNAAHFPFTVEHDGTGSEVPGATTITLAGGSYDVDENDIVFRDTDGLYKKALTGGPGISGKPAGVASIERRLINTGGLLSITTGFPIGTELFLSSTIDGALTDEPTSIQVALVLAADQILISPFGGVEAGASQSFDAVVSDTPGVNFFPTTQQAINSVSSGARILIDKLETLLTAIDMDSKRVHFMFNGPRAAWIRAESIVEIQQIDFSAVPDGGTWRIEWNAQESADLPFNASAQDVEDEFNLFSGHDGVVITGDYTAGFTITYNDEIDQVEPTFLDPGLNEIQKFNFGNIPDDGTIQFEHEGNPSANHAFNDTPAQLEIVIEGISSITQVTITGSFASQFYQIEFNGVDGLQPKSNITVIMTDLDLGGSPTTINGSTTTPIDPVNTQEGRFPASNLFDGATPIVILVSETQKGFPTGPNTALVVQRENVVIEGMGKIVNFEIGIDLNGEIGTRVQMIFEDTDDPISAGVLKEGIEFNIEGSIGFPNRSIKQVRLLDAISETVPPEAAVEVDGVNVAVGNCVLFTKPAIEGIYRLKGTSSLVNDDSVEFDGADGVASVTPNNALAVNISNKLTISGWVKASVDGANFKQILGHWDTAPNFKWLVGADSGSNKLTVHMSGDGSTIDKDYDSSIVILDGAYHHFVVVYDGTLPTVDQLKIYIDAELDTGVTKNTDNAMVTLFDNTSLIMVGQFLTTGATFSALNADQYSLWNFPLDTLEVAEVYGIGNPNDLFEHTRAVHIKAWWFFGEGGDAGTNIVDQQGTNDLTLAGGATFDTADSAGGSTTSLWRKVAAFDGQRVPFNGALVAVQEGDTPYFKTLWERSGGIWKPLKTHELQSEPTGFKNRDDSEISFDDGTRTFTIQPKSPAITFDFATSGTIHRKDAAQTVQIPDAEGLHFIYFDKSGDLQTTQVFTSDIITDFAFVSTISWDAVNDTAIILAEERHALTMDGKTHLYLHSTAGAKYVSGFGLTFDDAGDGSDDAHAQVALADGLIFDEDLEINIIDDPAPSEEFEQILDPIAEIPVFFRDGASGDWRKVTANTFPVLVGAPVPPVSQFSNLSGTGSGSAGDLDAFFFSQSFTTVGGFSVGQADLSLKSAGSTGNAVLEIWGISGGKPNDADVIGTSDVFDLTTLSAGFTVENFTFSTPVVLAGATQYALVLRNSGATTGNVTLENAGAFSGGNSGFAPTPGINATWTNNAADLFFEIFDAGAAGGGVLYNEPTGPWTQPEVTDTNFLAMWLFSTNGITDPIIAITGQRQDASLVDAQANNVYEALSFGVLPSLEMKVLFRVIYEVDGTFGNAVDARVVDVVDLRTSIDVSLGAFAPSAHNILSARTAPNSHPASAISTVISEFGNAIPQNDDEVQKALASLDKYFGQLQMRQHPTDTKRIIITGADVVKTDGTLLSQAVSNLIMQFDGAEIDFETGEIFEDDGTTPLGEDFVPVAIPSGEFTWYSVGIIPDVVTLGRISAKVLITPGEATGVTPALAESAPFAANINLGEVVIQEDSGSIADIVQDDIVQLGVGSASGGGSGNALDTKIRFQLFLDDSDFSLSKFNSFEAIDPVEFVDEPGSTGAFGVVTKSFDIDAGEIMKSLELADFEEMIENSDVFQAAIRTYWLLDNIDVDAIHRISRMGGLAGTFQTIDMNTIGGTDVLEGFLNFEVEKLLAIESEQALSDLDNIPLTPLLDNSEFLAVITTFLGPEGISGLTQRGSRFLTSSGYSLVTVNVGRLANPNSETGNIIMDLYADDGGGEPGALLTSSDLFDVTAIPVGNSTQTFTFSAPEALSATTTFHWIIRDVSLSGFITLEKNTGSDEVPDAAYMATFDGGSNWVTTNQDYAFELFSVFIPSAIVISQEVVLGSETDLKNFSFFLTRTGDFVGKFNIAMVLDDGSGDPDLTAIITQRGFFDVDTIGLTETEIVLNLDRVQVAATYHFVVLTDASYKTNFVDSVTEIAMSNGADAGLPNLKTFDGVIFTTASGDATAKYTLQSQTLILQTIEENPLANNDGEIVLNDTTNEFVAQPLVFADDRATFKQLSIDVNKATGDATGVLTLLVVLDDGSGDPDLSQQLMFKAFNIDDLSTGINNLVFDTGEIPRSAGTVHIVAQTDDAYKTQFISVPADFVSMRADTSPALESGILEAKTFNGTVWNDVTDTAVGFLMEGRILSLILEIESTIADAKVRAFGVAYEAKPGLVTAGNGLPIAFATVQPTAAEVRIALPSFVPLNRSFLKAFMQDGGGQVFMFPEFDIQGEEVIFEPGVFDVANPVVIRFEQFTPDVTDANPALIELLRENFLAGFGELDFGWPGRGPKVRADDGIMVEIQVTKAPRTIRIVDQE